MKIKYNFVIFITFLSLSSIFSETQKVAIQYQNEELKDFSKLETFVPTHEWQVVKPNQALPPGLHISINLSTGEKLAKINEDTTHQPNGSLQPPAMLYDRMKHNLDTLSTEEFVKSFLTKSHSFFIRYPQFDEILKSISSGLKESTSEQSSSSSSSSSSSPSSCEKVHKALLTLQDEIDDIDQAVDFSHSGGLSLLYFILHPSSTICATNEILATTWLVIGSALQNNPKVQDRAVSDGIMLLFQNHLQQLTSDESKIIENEKLISRLLYGLGAVLRHSSNSQEIFFEFKGWKSIISLFFSFTNNSIHLHKDCVSSLKKCHTNSSALRRILTIIFDISIERGVQKMISNLDLDTEIRNNFCQTLGHIISNSDDVDVFEQAINTLISLYQMCESSLPKDEILNTLKSKYSNIDNLSTTISDNEFDDTDVSAYQLFQKLRQ